MKSSKFEKILSGAKVKKLYSKYTFSNGTYIINSDAGTFVDLIKELRDNSQSKFKILLSICGADYPERKNRFEVVYNFLSIELNLRCLVKIEVAEDDVIPSVTDLFMSAGWYERETDDMYGVLFSGNPDLRRILTDYGFEGYPLRKDFPLTGYTEVRYDSAKKTVVYEPVSLNQEFRNFDFLSPWEGTNYILPGDEKATKNK